MWTFQEDPCGIFRRIPVDFSEGSKWSFQEDPLHWRWTETRHTGGVVHVLNPNRFVMLDYYHYLDTCPVL